MQCVLYIIHLAASSSTSADTTCQILEVLGVISSNKASFATSNYQDNAEILSTRPVVLEVPADNEDLSEQVSEHDHFCSLSLDHL
jgi:hypothetical protein